MIFHIWKSVGCCDRIHGKATDEVGLKKSFDEEGIRAYKRQTNPCGLFRWKSASDHFDASFTKTQSKQTSQLHLSSCLESDQMRMTMLRWAERMFWPMLFLWPIWLNCWNLAAQCSKFNLCGITTTGVVTILQSQTHFLALVVLLFRVQNVPMSRYLLIIYYLGFLTLEHCQNIIMENPKHLEVLMLSLWTSSTVTVRFL